MKKLLFKVRADFPALTITPGERFSWSPKNREIIYKKGSLNDTANQWALLHELGHATLGHNTYKSDFELLQLEVAAWEEAVVLAKKYQLFIDEDHIQDCLDTYRDWLHRRSTCPTCGNRSLQENAQEYACFNCGCRWHVTASRFCRPYRRVASHQSSVISSLERGGSKKSPVHKVKQATFA